MARELNWIRQTNASPSTTGFAPEWGMLYNPIGFDEGATVTRTVGRVSLWVDPVGITSANYQQALGGAFGYTVYFDDRSIALTPGDATITTVRLLDPQWEENVLWQDYSPLEVLSARPQDNFSVLGYRAQEGGSRFDTSKQRRCISKTPGQKCRLWVFTESVSDFFIIGSMPNHRVSTSIQVLVKSPGP